VLKILFFLGVHFLEIWVVCVCACVRVCVFFCLFLFWGFESTLLQEFESRVRKASQDGAGGAGGSHLACPPTDEQRHSHR
jgi:hypothetical protein